MKDPPPPPSGSFFTNDQIGYRYGTRFKEPGVNNGNDIEKNILELQHFNTDKYGSNFMNLDVLFSPRSDPTADGSQGATEFYLVLRRDWSLSKITQIKINNAIIKDIDLHMGADFNTKDTIFAPEKRLLVIGPQLQFNVPVGFFNVAFDYSHEWNHNGLGVIPGIRPAVIKPNVDFDGAFEIEATWSFPFKIGNSELKFSGFLNYVAPKGRDGQNLKTVSEVLTRPEIMLDVGNYWGQKGKMEVGFGYEYWLNKFGNNHDNIVGSYANTPEFIARYHF